MIISLIISYGVTVSYILSSPDKLQAILQFILEALDFASNTAFSSENVSQLMNNKPSFYLSDGNAFAFILVERSFNFVARIYFPFLVVVVYFRIVSARTASETSLFNIRALCIPSTLIFAFFRNHFDLAPSTII
jgi:hypothetical protein